MKAYFRPNLLQKVVKCYAFQIVKTSKNQICGDFQILGFLWPCENWQIVISREEQVVICVPFSWSIFYRGKFTKFSWNSKYFIQASAFSKMANLSIFPLLERLSQRVFNFHWYSYIAIKTTWSLCGNFPPPHIECIELQWSHWYSINYSTDFILFRFAGIPSPLSLTGGIW